MVRRKGKNCFFNTQKILCSRCFHFSVKTGAASVLFCEKMEGGIEFLGLFTIIVCEFKIGLIMKRVLYVHGFRGSAYGRGYKRVLSALPGGYKLFSIDYDEADCSHAREQILNFIDEFKIDLVIGSSLGGFITLTLNGIPRFVINPCWDPPVELCKLVEQDAAFTKMIKTYMPYEIWIAKSVNYQEKMLVKGFFGKYDELFGTKYVEEFSGYYSSYEMIDSGHHLSEEGAKQIFKNIDDYWKRVRILENMQKANDDIISDVLD